MVEQPILRERKRATQSFWVLGREALVAGLRPRWTTFSTPTTGGRDGRATSPNRTSQYKDISDDKAWFGPELNFEIAAREARGFVLFVTLW
jgi:hypothetical protein